MTYGFTVVLIVTALLVGLIAMKVAQRRGEPAPAKWFLVGAASDILAVFAFRRLWQWYDDRRKK